MDIRVNPPTVFRLALTGAMLAADLEGHRHYHQHSDVHFDADLAYGRCNVSAYTTGRSVSLAAVGVARGMGTAAVTLRPA